MGINRNSIRNAVLAVLAGGLLASCSGPEVQPTPTPTQRPTLTYTVETADDAPQGTASAPDTGVPSAGATATAETLSEPSTSFPASSGEPASAAGPPRATASTRIDLDDVDLNDPRQAVGAFVTAYAQRSSADSQADNFAIRAAPFATPRLQQQMVGQVRTDPNAIPTAGRNTVIITAVTPMPAASSENTRAFRVVYTVRRFERDQRVGQMTEVALNCVLVHQADGLWLIDSVGYGAN